MHLQSGTCREQWNAAFICDGTAPGKTDAHLLHVTHHTSHVTQHALSCTHQVLAALQLRKEPAAGIHPSVIPFTALQENTFKKCRKKHSHNSPCKHFQNVTKNSCRTRSRERVDVTPLRHPPSQQLKPEVRDPGSNIHDAAQTAMT
jgi:hypothetical protein